jgi:transposase-like protein
MKTDERQTDKRGRVQRTAEQRRELIEEYRASGLSKAEFCRQRGVNLATFCHWFGGRKKHRGKRAAKTAERGPQFAEVAVASPATEQAAVEVLLPNGARIGIRHQGRRDELIALVRGVAGYRPGAA